MFNLVETLYSTYDKKIPLISLDRKEESKYYLNPSSSGVYTKEGSYPLGACIKRVWLDKKGFPSTNPSSHYNKLNFDFGNMIEDWVIDKCKQAGIYLDSNVKIIDNDLNLSGEIDILIKNPITGDQEVIEVKSYNGGLYQNAKEVLGSKDALPKPKDGYILQCVTYLLMLKKYNIHKINLLYIDKSASKLYNNKQFVLYLKGDDIYYDTYHQNQLVTIKEDRFNLKDVLERNSTLITLLEEDYVPPPDFIMEYTSEQVEDFYMKGEIPKYKYEAYKKHPDTTELGSWQCSYCPYSKNLETGESTCINITNETKDFYRD